MSQFHDHVAEIADDFVHRLLDAGRAAEVERHCAGCPACKAAVDDARRRLALLQANRRPRRPKSLSSKRSAKSTPTRRAPPSLARFLAAAGGLLAASVVVLVWMHVYYYNLAATPYDLVVLGQRSCWPRPTARCASSSATPGRWRRSPACRSRCGWSIAPPARRPTSPRSPPTPTAAAAALHPARLGRPAPATCVVEARTPGGMEKTDQKRGR